MVCLGCGHTFWDMARIAYFLVYDAWSVLSGVWRVLVNFIPLVHNSETAIRLQASRSISWSALVYLIRMPAAWTIVVYVCTSLLYLPSYACIVMTLRHIFLNAPRIPVFQVCQQVSSLASALFLFRQCVFVSMEPKQLERTRDVGERRRGVYVNHSKKSRTLK